jgi:ABC-2 type transport system permease protein
MTGVLAHNARILRVAFLGGLADMRAIYDWRTWVLGWLARVLCQVAFFALIARLLDVPGKLSYLLVGNAVFALSYSVMQVCASTGWERKLGTLPLLVIAPSTQFTVFAGRSLFWLIDGVACSTIALFLLAPLFAVELPMPRAMLTVPIIALIAVAVYGYGLVLSAFALRAPRLRAVVGNMGNLSLMVLTGVQVPSHFWPSSLEAVAGLLPITHGLQAIRGLLGEGQGAMGSVAMNTTLEAVVAAGWLILAAVAFRHLVNHCRKDGSLDFSD